MTGRYACFGRCDSCEGSLFQCWWCGAGESVSVVSIMLRYRGSRVLFWIGVWLLHDCLCWWIPSILEWVRWLYIAVSFPHLLRSFQSFYTFAYGIVHFIHSLQNTVLPLPSIQRIRVKMLPHNKTPLSPSLHSVKGTCGSTHIWVVRNGIKRGVAQPAHFKRCKHGYFLTDFQWRNTDIVDEKQRLFAWLLVVSLSCVVFHAYQKRGWMVSGYRYCTPSKQRVDWIE